MRAFFPLLVFAVLSVPAAPASAAEVLVACNLIDSASQRFCGADAVAASVCTLNYTIDDANKVVKVVNPGRILPDFVVRSWSSDSISLVRTIEMDDDTINLQFNTEFNRTTGRMYESSVYVERATGAALSASRQRDYEASRVRQMGMWGYLDKTRRVGECKVTQRAF